MSHVSTLPIRITADDMPYAIQAAKECGLELRLDEKTGQPRRDWRWWGRWANDYNSADAAYRQNIPVERYGRDAEYVFGIEDDIMSYELGMVKDDSGALRPCFDFY